MSDGSIRYQGWRPENVAPRNFAADWLSDKQIAYAMARRRHRMAFIAAAGRIAREKPATKRGGE